MTQWNGRRTFVLSRGLEYFTESELDMQMGVHNFSLPDELWASIQRAAAKAGAKRGKPMSVSEWIRRR